MPVGIKDIIETADMPTEQGSPLFVGCRTGRDAASVAALREAGAVILGKVVTTEFAATEPRGTRNPWDRERTPGGSSSGSAAAVACGMVPAALGTQVVGSILRPGKLLRLRRLQAERWRGSIAAAATITSARAAPACSPPSLEDAWLVASDIAARAGGDPGYPGLQGPPNRRRRGEPRTLAVLQTSGWEEAAPEARAAFEAAAARLAAAGIALADRHADPVIEEVEGAIADARRYPQRSTPGKGAGRSTPIATATPTKLSRGTRTPRPGRGHESRDDYRMVISRRAEVRAIYARLPAGCDALVTLAAPARGAGRAARPAIRIFTVPSSLLGRAGAVAAGARRRGPAARIAAHRLHGWRCGAVRRGGLDQDFVPVTGGAKVRVWRRRRWTIELRPPR